MTVSSPWRIRKPRQPKNLVAALQARKAAAQALPAPAVPPPPPAIPPQPRLLAPTPSPQVVPLSSLEDFTRSGNRIIDVRDIVAFPETPDIMATRDGNAISALRFLDSHGTPVLMGGPGLVGPPGPGVAEGGLPGQILLKKSTVDFDTLWSDAGLGTVSSVSVATANGFNGTVATPTTTPVISLGTTVTGMLKGTAGTITAAIAGTDYLTPAGGNALYAPIVHTHTASQITDFAEATDDRVSALIVGGTNITSFYNDSAGTLTISAAAYPTSLPPSGPAGGALSGNYPNPTLVGGPLSNYLTISDAANTYFPQTGGTLTAPGNLTIPTTGLLTVLPTATPQVTTRTSVPQMLGTDNSSNIASTSWVRSLFATRGQGAAIYAYDPSGNTAVDPGTGEFAISNLVVVPADPNAKRIAISKTDADLVSRFLMLFLPGDSLIVTNELVPTTQYARYDITGDPIDMGTWVQMNAVFIGSQGAAIGAGQRVKITGYLNTATGDGPILGVAAGYGLTGGGASGNVELDVDSAVIAPLASPVFTGNPTLTTVLAAGDNDQSLATTKFVKDQGYLSSSAADATYVNVAGDTMTGPLTGTTANFTGPLSISGKKAIEFSDPEYVSFGSVRAGMTIGEVGNNYYNASNHFLRSSDTTTTFATINASGTALTGPLTGTTATFSVQVGAGGGGTGAALIVNGGASNTGYISFHEPDGTRRGYIGYGSPGNEITYANDRGGAHVFGGEVRGSKAAFTASTTEAGVFTGPDGSNVVLIRGGSKAVRFAPQAGGMVIQGVDQTGVTSFEPLEIYGTYVNISGPMSNVGIGNVPLSNVKLYLKGQTTNADWLIYCVDSANTFKFAVSDNGDFHMPGHIYGKSAQFPGNVTSTLTSPTPPVSPLDGQLWFNSDASTGGGTLYIRYNDGNTSQWVPASPPTTGTSTTLLEARIAELEARIAALEAA
jgi:hypothetical protein